MHAAQGNQPGASIDVSIHEALATLSMTELARAGLTGKSWDRKRLSDGNGATVTILPATRWLRRDLPARGEAVGGVAGRDGVARLGRRPALRAQGRIG